ncbi:MAG: O-antigen ligase family protein [Hyphomicrobiaceae bacterium]
MTTSANPPLLHTTTALRLGTRDWLAIAHTLAWFLFLIFASTALTGLGIEKSERIAWFPGYLAIAAVLLIGPLPLLTEVRRHLWLLSWPLLAGISVIWSLNPGKTLYFSFQLLMTILIAFQFTIGMTRDKALRLVFLSLLVVQGICLAFAALQPSAAFGLSGELRGTFLHKNTLGALMAVQILTAMALLASGWRRPLAGAGLALAALLLLLSRSGTAMASLALPALLLAIVWISLRARRLLDFALGFGLILLAAAILYVVTDVSDLLGTLLDGLGKDRTLTGRTLLWQLGMDAWGEEPLLGLGYKGYWEGAPEKVAYLRYLSGQALWFFHNNFIEIAVAFGWVGLTLFVTSLVLFIWRAATRLATHPSGETGWSVAMLLFLVSYAMAENPLFENHSYFHILLAIAVSHARPPAIRLRG